MSDLETKRYVYLLTVGEEGDTFVGIYETRKLATDAADNLFPKHDEWKSPNIVTVVGEEGTTYLPAAYEDEDWWAYTKDEDQSTTDEYGEVETMTVQRVELNRTDWQG